MTIGKMRVLFDTIFALGSAALYIETPRRISARTWRGQTSRTAVVR